MTENKINNYISEHKDIEGAKSLNISITFKNSIFGWLTNFFTVNYIIKLLIKGKNVLLVIVFYYQFATFFKKHLFPEKIQVYYLK